MEETAASRDVQDLDLVLYGREAYTDDSGNSFEAVEGVVSKVRKADKALNEAYNALNEAEKNLNMNQDP